MHNATSDGPRLSFVPKNQSDTKAARTVGAIVTLCGIGFLCLALWLTLTSSAVKNTGLQAPGILIGYQRAAGTQPSGMYAVVQVQEKNGATLNAISKLPVTFADPTKIGSVYSVFYTQKTPVDTFIDGIDQPVVPWSLIFTGAGTLATGVILFLVPPRTTSVVKGRERPDGTAGKINRL